MQEETALPESGRWRFIGQQIEVTLEGEPPQPAGFTMAGRDHRISHILLSWFDWGFPAGATQRDWRTRRHRRCFRVATDQGEVFEIYHDRRSAGEEGDWVCYQEWDPNPTEL